MKKPLLKILPGVAVIMISPSCTKDNDIIKEDNTALVAEQVIQKKVFHIKIQNATTLKKMGIANLGTEGTNALKFNEGDELRLTFNISKGYDDSGEVGTMEYTVSMIAKCINKDGEFEVNNNEYKVLGCSYIVDLSDEISVALQEMQDGIFDAAVKYNVQLKWGDNKIINSNDFVQNGFVGFDDMTTMFKNAPRSADQSFTLKQEGYYCFLVIEEGCTKKVEVNDAVLCDETAATNKQMYFIVNDEATLKINGENKGKLSSENLYYVRKQTSNVEE